MSKFYGIGALAIAVTASGALAQTWVETGDAGQLPGTAQAAGGVGALTHITGTLSDQADVFLISITGGSASFTTETGGTSFDTQLFLFSATGMGVASNDDTTGSAPYHSTLGGALLSGLAPGNYLIGISAFGTEPNSAGGLIFPDSFPGVFGPTGPGGGSPLSTWAGGAGAGSYDILMTGVSFVPGPFSLAVLGLAGLTSRRRRA